MSRQPIAPLLLLASLALVACNGEMPVDVDNNSVPTGFLENINFVGNPDVHDGIPLGFRVFDGDASTGEPADEVQLVFQWRDANEPYPPLPTTPTAIQTIVDDPVLRQQFQIASGDADAVRLPERLRRRAADRRPVVPARSGRPGPGRRHGSVAPGRRRAAGGQGRHGRDLLPGSGGGFADRETLGQFPLSSGTLGAFTAIGDLDSDGVLDLVLMSTSGTAYLEQVQPGTFEPGFADLTGLGLGGALLHDVDLDGHVDLVYSSDATTVARLQGAPGEFGEGQVLADWSSVDVAFGDIDGDGDADMALSTPGPPSVRVLLRDEQGVLQPATSLSPNNSSSSDVDLADVGGDGRLDLIVADTFLNTVAVHFGDHRPDLTLGPIIGDVGEGIEQLRFVDQGDLDGDGDGDLDLAITGLEEVEIHYQVLPGVYELATALLADTGSGFDAGPSVSHTADVDLDGLLDVVAFVGVDLVVFAQATDRSFSSLPQGALAGGGRADDFDVVDLDGDGLPDVVASYRDTAGNSSIFYPEASGSFAAVPQVVGQLESAGTVNASIADMDGDGDLDFVISLFDFFLGSGMVLHT